MNTTSPRLAILYPGDRAARDRSDPVASRFAALFRAFAEAGVAVEPAIYHDDFCAEVEAQRTSSPCPVLPAELNGVRLGTIQQEVSSERGDQRITGAGL